MTTLEVLWFYRSLRPRRGRLTLRADGSALLQDGQLSAPVLLLPHRSYWLRAIAGISVQTPERAVRVLWAFRCIQLPENWRRARFYAAWSGAATA